MAWLVCIAGCLVAVCFVAWIVDQDEDDWPAV